MSNPKHTPGPWRKGRLNDCHKIYAANSWVVGEVRGATRGRACSPWHTASQANARLIAAAPELYACVFSLLRNFPQLGTDEPLNGPDLIDWLNDQLPYWQAALKKAEGRDHE